jgi:hypothetical protein
MGRGGRNRKCIPKRLITAALQNASVLSAVLRPGATCLITPAAAIAAGRSFLPAPDNFQHLRRLLDGPELFNGSTNQLITGEVSLRFRAARWRKEH